MSGPTIIAVFGLSGVGKTTMIRQWLIGRDDALHLQASTLIKQAVADPALDSEVLRRSSGDRILANQDILVEAFGRSVSASSASLVIFDGHLVIDTDERLTEIPLTVIAGLRPHALVHVEQAPQIIADQRRGDATRNRPMRAPGILQQQQERSRALCQAYGQELGIEVVVVFGEGTLPSVERILFEQHDKSLTRG